MRRKKPSGVIIVSTRPDVIKLAPIITKFRKDHFFKLKVIATGQHQELMEEALKIFKIKSDYNLKIMRKKQNLFWITTQVMLKINLLLKKIKPRFIIVQGDTTSALAVSLAAYYHKIDLIHIEAGLRSGKKYSPYPEETNRRLISQLADWHFAPTAVNKDNLIASGIPADRIFVTGNPIVDALQLMVTKNIKQTKKSKIILVTAHRRESWEKGFSKICQALLLISKKHPKYKISFPLHPNPMIKKIADRKLAGKKNIQLINHLPYQKFIKLIASSWLILTDSGGVQEEAVALKTPALILREVTDRPEGVKVGALKIVGTEPDKIYNEVSKLINYPHLYQSMIASKNPYGDGRAADKIIKVLKNIYLK